MKKTIYCPDITCESCVKVLTRVFSNFDGINTFAVKKDHILVDFNEKKVRADRLLEAIREKGYRAGFTPFSRKTFRERARDFVSNRKKYVVEYTMLRYVAYAFLLLLILEALAYYVFFRYEPDFLNRYGWWLFYTTLSAVSVGAAIWHFKAYKTEIPHMTGMMIGMTIGMTSGLMIGTIIAVTNGLFVGVLTGMILSSLVGWYTGKCCGIMGVLEGLMAGVMGSMMGSMIGVMLISEHILIFMPVFMILMLIVLGGLSYMLFEEVVEDKEAIERSPADFWTFFSYCFLATFVLILIMLYGWKSAIVMVM